MTPTVLFSQVSKKYKIGRRGFPSLRSLFSSATNSHPAKYHWAVKDVSFELESGEALGIIGPNGAGKTTILKLLSQVTYPTAGKVQINGKYSALIELGAGFHPDLTGRENVFLNGTILGLPKAEIKKKFDEIVEFAGVSTYLDTPVKRYSSGMYARLGFSIAAHVDPEVLIVDEVLAVGDASFRKKCYQRMTDLISKGTTLVFVSHDLSAVQKVCSRSLVMYQGKKVYEGGVANAIAEYSNILRNAEVDHKKGEQSDVNRLAQMVMTHDATIEDVKLLDEDGNPRLTFQGGETIRVSMLINFHENAPSPVFACTVRQTDGVVVFDYTTDWANQETPNFSAGSQARIEFLLKASLTSGMYSLGVDLAYHDLSCYYDRIVRAVDFLVTSKNGSQGIADLDAEFRVVETV